jgi:hypothetical protein
MRWLRKQPRRKKPGLRLDDPALGDLVPLEFKDKLPALVRRIVMDLMKRPGPPGLSRKPARRPTARKPTAKRRRRSAG